MKLLDRYIFREYLVSFCFSSLSFISLFILINLIEKVDDFIDQRVTLSQIITYYAYQIPEIIKLTSPISSLLSALFVTGKLAKQTELTAMKAGGISLYRLLYPFYSLAILIAIFNFYLSGWVVPNFTKYKYQFESTYLGKAHNMGGSRSNINLLENPNRIVNIGYFDSNARICYNVSVQNFSGPVMQWRVDADKMVYNTARKSWTLHNAYYRTFKPGKEVFQRFDSLKTIRFTFSAKQLSESNTDVAEMDLLDHRKYIASKSKAGFSALDEVLVKYYAKISFPFACLIVVLIGVPLSAQKKRSGLALEAGISLLIGFIYIGLQEIFATLGYKGTVPPFLAAWLPNVFFFSVGLIMLTKSKK